jgi:hypothetical protein
MYANVRFWEAKREGGGGLEGVDEKKGGFGGAEAVAQYFFNLVWLEIFAGGFVSGGCFSYKGPGGSWHAALLTGQAGFARATRGWASMRVRWATGNLEHEKGAGVSNSIVHMFPMID